MDDLVRLGRCVERAWESLIALADADRSAAARRGGTDDWLTNKGIASEGALWQIVGEILFRSLP
jgi:hypothetical protein